MNRLYNSISDEKKIALRDYRRELHKLTREWVREDYEDSLIEIKELFKKIYNFSDKKINRIIETVPPGRFVRFSSKIGLTFLIISIVSFLSALITSCFI